MLSPRITQKDIALKTGVNRATVSLAFRSHPSIPAATRERILRIADELGYMPDPMLTALAQYRHHRRPAAFHGTLAWLVCLHPEYDWKRSPHYLDYYTGASQRAVRHGFKLEVVEFDPAGMNVGRMASILRARNIGGILLCPQPTAHAVMDFPWEHFAAVTFGYTLSRPAMHTVTAAHYRSVRQTIAELCHRGYTRIGVAINDNVDRRCDDTYRAGFLISRSLGSPDLFCEPFHQTLDIIETPAPFLAWIRKAKPDAILTTEFRTFPLVRSAGFRVPADIGMACASLPTSESGMSGIVENSIHIGEIAVDQLVAMINRGERGIPEYPQRLHVEGKWHEGQSLRARPA
ncbi:LacI family transcription regulator [Opitutaceae bacterium TAV5]|nr:LacI family transcription regulator [Opitutaceae bacterium TAV5]